MPIYCRAGLACLQRHRHSGVFHISNVDWSKQLNAGWYKREQRFSMSQENFIDLMKQQYGFDKETSIIMFKVYETLQKNYPNATQKEIDWRFARLLGGFVYDGFKWNQTAGNAIDKKIEELYGNIYSRDMTEEEYFTETLGLPKEQYRLIMYKIRVQYYISGMENADLLAQNLNDKDFKDYKKKRETALGKNLSDKEFTELWNEQYYAMKGKGDFAHQQITTAAILATDINKSGIITDIYFLGDDEKRENMAGWLGDATIKANNEPPSFGGDDYIADLDAENITYLMEKEGYSYIDATKVYYSRINSNYTRAQMFLEHTSLEEVKNEIYSELVIPEIMKGLTLTEAEYRSMTPKEAVKYRKHCEVALSEKNKMNKLKEIAPDTYNFVKSLEEPEKYNEMRK